jgi:hypothetical protein
VADNQNPQQRGVFEIGGETIPAELLWQARFAEDEPFLFEAQGGDCRFADGKAVIDCCEKRGATLWLKREFPANLIIEFAGECVAPSAGNNLNLFFCAASGDGRPLDSVPRTGEYAEYHQFPNYIFTLTAGHTRIRRDPGFELLSELMLGAVADHRYLVQIGKVGGRIAALIDGRLIHEVNDPTPLGAGWVGLRTWNSKVVYDHWAVYQPRLKA